MIDCTFWGNTSKGILYLRYAPLPYGFCYIVQAGLFFISAISLLAIGCYTLRLASRLYTMHIGLGIHVLVADLDGDKITALRPQVERTLAIMFSNSRTCLVFSQPSSASRCMAALCSSCCAMMVRCTMDSANILRSVGVTSSFTFAPVRLDFQS